MADSPEHGSSNDEQQFTSSYEGLFDQRSSDAPDGGRRAPAQPGSSSTEPAAPAQEFTTGDYMPITQDGKIDWAELWHRTVDRSLAEPEQFDKGSRNQLPSAPEGLASPADTDKNPSPGSVTESDQHPTT